jgi:hypothetical protein
MESTIKATIEANDTMEDDNIETSYETPAIKKQNGQERSSPFVRLKDCATDWDKFTVAKEANGNNKSEQFRKELELLFNLFAL